MAAHHRRAAERAVSIGDPGPDEGHRALRCELHQGLKRCRAAARVAPSPHPHPRRAWTRRSGSPAMSLLRASRSTLQKSARRSSAPRTPSNEASSLAGSGAGQRPISSAQRRRTRGGAIRQPLVPAEQGGGARRRRPREAEAAASSATSPERSESAPTIRATRPLATQLSQPRHGAAAALGSRLSQLLLQAAQLRTPGSVPLPRRAPRSPRAQGLPPPTPPTASSRTQPRSLPARHLPLDSSNTIPQPPVPFLRSTPAPSTQGCAAAPLACSGPPPH